jgi:two-component system CheB/CheR fusion protein
MRRARRPGSAKARGAASPARGRKGSAQSIPEETPSPQPSVSFPIVGIGASAGGLEALEQFFGRVPARSGMAFVVVQHLDPTRKGLMPELLQRSTELKVVQVRDRAPVRPNCVYVIPPGKDMSILRGVLHLFEPTATRGLRLPIDSFLRSLALDQQQKSIGVILSGMGSDGTLGMRAIKEMAGLALVQTPATAKFDSMPRSAIDAGLADIVAPAEELAGKIVAYLQRTPLPAKPEGAVEEKMRSALEKTVILLRVHTGHDFSLYKKNTLYRRIERRMGIHQIDKMGDYVRYLQENSQELDLLFKELLIGVTSFFRDPAAWQQLREEIVPALLAGRAAGTPTNGAHRAWVAGCSTGEEAYSLAMVFKEAADALKPAAHHTLQIFATDIDRDAIDKARVGVYPENIAVDVSPERLARFFTKEATGYRVKSEIRETVIFAQHSLIADPPFTRLDILSCRNLLIYLAPEMQKKLIPLFHYALQPNGILVLGSAETVGGFPDLFAQITGKSRIFRRSESAQREAPIEFPSSFGRAFQGDAAVRVAQTPALSLQAMAEQLVLTRFSPPTVLVNDKGNILYISGKTGRYLEPAAGKANWNIFAMARDGLEYDLSAAFHKALRRPGAVTVRGLKVGADDARHYVDVTVERLEVPEPMRGLVMVVFADAAAPAEPHASGRSRKSHARNPRVTELEAELQQARTELQNTREGMQTSQEELKSTNEEMQSTNEELQSTNEELTTSKEEMQSMNEELQTVNHELQGKVDELSRTNNDMQNLLNSTDIATLFLDNDLRVRRFTTQAAKIIKLIPGDVGRPITDLASDLLYPDLAEDVRGVLRTLGSAEKAISGRDGCWFAVRVMPYRTHDDRIDGVVITLADITVAKTLEAKLREKQAALERHVARQSGQMEKSRARSAADARSRRSGRADA